MNTSMLAVISGNALVSCLIWLVCGGLICWLLWWFIGFIGLPEPFNKIAKVLVALVAVILCINALMTVAGSPIIRF